MSDDIQVKNAPLIRSVRRGPDLPSLSVDEFELIGRTRELNQLMSLFSDQARSRVVALVGLGGIGKTKLAIAFAHRIASSFPDGVFFYRAEGENIQRAITETIRLLAPTARLPSGELDLLFLYRHLLAGKRVLTILDDVENEETVKLFIPAPPSALLVISRLNLSLAGVAKVQLGLLTAEEAVSLLRANLDTKRDFKFAELAHIAEALDRHPLVLKLAAEYLNANPLLSIDEWLAVVSRQRQQNTLGNLLERLLARVSERVPREQIGVLGTFEGRFTLEAVREMWEADERTAREKLDALSSIIVMEGGRLGIHELVKTFLRDTFRGEIERVRPRHAAYFLSELRQIADQYQDLSQRPAALRAFEASRADIEAGHAWAQQAASMSSEAGGLLINYVTAGIELFASQLPAAKWVGWIERALGECEKAGRDDQQGLLLYSLGTALLNQGRTTEARRHLERCIAFARVTKDVRTEGIALGALGFVHSQMGDMSAAIRFYEQNLSIARSIADTEAIANAIGNLGIAYASIGEIHRAIEYFEQQLAMARSLSDFAGEASAIGNLGLCRSAQDQLEEARSLFEHQLTLSRNLGDMRGEASALNNLGSVMLKRGDIIKATDAFERAISIARHLNDRWQEGRLIGNLGNAYLAAGQIATAIDAYEQQADIAKTNSDRAGEANALWNSAVALEANGNIEAAITRAGAALNIRRELNDPNLTKVADWLRAHGVNELSEFHPE